MLIYVAHAYGGNPIDANGNSKSFNRDALLDLQEIPSRSSKGEVVGCTMIIHINEKRFAQMYQQNPDKATHDVDSAIHNAFEKSILHFKKKYKLT